MFDRRVLFGALSVVSLAACDISLASHNEIYSRGPDHFVLCAQNIDDKDGISTDEISEALMRAKIEGTTLHIYAHRYGNGVETSTVETILAAAAERGVSTVTYDKLTAGEVPGSLALSFDDHNLESWMAMRPVLDRYQAKVTFFISAYTTNSNEDRAAVRRLADDGHDIEYHSVAHRNAAKYTQEHGVDAYIADEIVPALEAMRADGYAPTVFAYPFGARTAQIDEALKPYFVNVRAIRSTCPR